MKKIANQILSNLMRRRLQKAAAQAASQPRMHGVVYDPQQQAQASQQRRQMAAQRLGHAMSPDMDVAGFNSQMGAATPGHFDPSPQPGTAPTPPVTPPGHAEDE